MKKNVARILILFSVFLLLCTIMIVTRNRNKISTYEYKRNDLISRNFEMLTLNTNDVLIHVEVNDKKVKEEKKILKETKELVDRIIKTTRQGAAIKSGKKKHIYLIDTIVGKEWYQEKENLVITKALAGSRELEQSVIRLLYNCDYWVGYGMSASLHGEKADLTFLKKYYGKAENIRTLSLFGARFFELIAAEDEKKAVENTAVSFYSYIEEKEELSVILDGENHWDSLLVLKNDWLNHIGIRSVYENENEKILKLFQYEGSEKYPLIIKFDPFIFYMDEGIYQMIGFDKIKNVNELETALCISCQDVQNMIDYLEKNLPERLLSKMNCLDKGVPCRFNQIGKNSTGSKNGISLLRLTDFSHEAVHAMFVSNGTDGQRNWLDEGLANYLGMVKFGHYNAIKMVQYFDNACKNERDIPVEFSDYKLYRKMEGKTHSSDSLDMDRYYKAYVYSIKMNQAYADCFKVSDSLKTIYSYKKIDNGTADWTYAECEQFVVWLIEKYSLATVLEVNFDYGRLEDLFGKKLTELHEEWEKDFFEYMEAVLKN